MRSDGEWSLAATCNAGGSKNWTPGHAAFLKDADVVLVPDHDNAGWQHINVVGAALTTRQAYPRSHSARSAAQGGHCRLGAIRRHPRRARRACGPSPLLGTAGRKARDLDEEKQDAEQSEDELLDALAKMPKGVAFGRERKRLAKELGVNTSDLDAEIEGRRTEAETNALLHGHWHVEPSPEPADGDALIRDIIKKLQRHVVMSHESALAAALWIMLAWVHDEVATHSPILDVTSAEPESGKTTLSVWTRSWPRGQFPRSISARARSTAPSSVGSHRLRSTSSIPFWPTPRPVPIKPSCAV